MAEYTLERAEELRKLYNTSVANGLMIQAKHYERQYERVMNELGFCPKDGDAMPCMTCGAGL